MNKSQIQLVIIILLFALPIVAGWILLYNPELLPKSRSNQGILLSPPIALPDFSFIDSNQKLRKSSAAHQGFWTLIMLGTDGDECENSCQKRLYALGQIRKALEEDYKKIKRLLILGQNQNVRKVLHKFEDSNDFGIAVNIQAVFNPKHEADIYLMDPNRDLIMAYTPRHKPKAILKDMQKLLAVNRWGSGH